MVANFLAGGAAINVIAREVGAAVVAVDVGVATPIPAPPPPAAAPDGDPAVAPTAGRLVSANVRPGTANLALQPGRCRSPRLARRCRSASRSRTAWSSRAPTS